MQSAPPRHPPGAAHQPASQPTHLLRRRPLRLQLVLVERPLENPAEAGHGLHPVQERRVAAGVLVALVVPGADAVHCGVLL